MRGRRTFEVRRRRRHHPQQASSSLLKSKNTLTPRLREDAGAGRKVTLDVETLIIRVANVLVVSQAVGVGLPDLV